MFTLHHVSHVKRQVSGVICQVSGVRCHVSPIFVFFFFGQIGGASLWRVCYQRGIRQYLTPCMNLLFFKYKNISSQGFLKEKKFHLVVLQDTEPCLVSYLIKNKQ